MMRVQQDSYSEGLADALRNIAVLIPAWQPERGLIDLVKALSVSDFGGILIVDDGSSSESKCIFEELQGLNVRLVRHAVNLGKGRALKTGFNCLMTEYPSITGVVTADADGQHTAADILSVAEALCQSHGRSVLGARTFGGDVPLRSKFGNLLTRSIFSFVTGTKLQDTQTGLRGLPVQLLPQMMLLDGERYEYEMTMLAHLCREGGKPVEVPIETVYLEGNRSSHFNPIWDSMRIYFVLARFYLSSVFAAGIDFAGFTLCFAATANLPLSVAVGRLSSLVNFALNRRFVFHNRGSLGSALWRYYVLVAAIAGISYVLIKSLTMYLHWNVYATKIVVDVLLSLVSFATQRTFVFRRKQEA